MDLPQDYKRLKRLKPETADVEEFVQPNFSEVFSDGRQDFAVGYRQQDEFSMQ